MVFFLQREIISSLSQGDFERVFSKAAKVVLRQAQDDFC